MHEVGRFGAFVPGASRLHEAPAFVADATAALTDAAHNATLENMAMLFADVMTTAEVLTAVTRSVPHR